MASYGSYHRDPRNRATHFVGVPMIVFAILIPMCLTRGGDDLPILALAVVVASAIYYMSLSLVLGIALAVIYGAMLIGADAIARMGAGTAWSCFGVLFVVGWAFQLLGHKFEGNRPALLDNLHQTLVAPIFLAAEAGFMLGWGKGLKEEVERASGMAGRA
jgi:uncharacterized membrane protein YGL010W